MSQVKIQGNASGTGIFTVAAPNSNTDRTLTLPDNAGTILTSASSLAGLTGVGKVLQIVSSVTTGVTDTTSSSYVVTSHSVTITPSSSTSKILILHNGMINILASNSWMWYTLYRNSTNLATSGAAGGALGGVYNASSTDSHCPTSVALLDSPSTTSATTYAIYVKTNVGARGRYNADGWYATINALEIAA